jgi:hypothetical protein
MHSRCLPQVRAHCTVMMLPLVRLSHVTLGYRFVCPQPCSIHRCYCDSCNSLNGVQTRDRTLASRMVWCYHLSQSRMVTGTGNQRIAGFFPNQIRLYYVQYLFSVVFKQRILPITLLVITATSLPISIQVNNNLITSLLLITSSPIRPSIQTQPSPHSLFFSALSSPIPYINAAAPNAVNATLP